MEPMPLRLAPILSAITLGTLLLVGNVTSAVGAPPASCNWWMYPAKVRVGETRQVSIICADFAGGSVEVLDGPDLATLTPGAVSALAQSFTLTAGATPGVDEVTYRATNADGTSAPTTTKLEIRPSSANEAPTCTNRSGSPEIGAGGTVQLAAACTDPDGDPYLVEPAAPPAHGTATGDAFSVDRIEYMPRSLIYQPPLTFSGTERIVMRARDNRGATSELPFDVTVKPADPPTPDQAKKPSPPAPPTLAVGTLPRLELALRHGLSVSLTSTVPGRARATLTLDGATAKALKLSAKRRDTTVATGSRVVRPGNATTVTVRFTPAARRAISRRFAKLRLRLSVRVGSAPTATRTVTLKRQPR